MLHMGIAAQIPDQSDSIDNLNTESRKSQSHFPKGNLSFQNCRSANFGRAE